MSFELSPAVVVFILTITGIVISVMLYLGGLDKRITIMEQSHLKKDDFYKGMKDLEKCLIKKIDEKFQN